jgi:mono/diheme cytochrome c family protein
MTPENTEREMRDHTRGTRSLVLTLTAALCLVATSALADVKDTVQQQCGQCHRLTEGASSTGKAPDLHFAGNKFRPEWLAAFLAKPTPIRHTKYGTLEKGEDPCQAKVTAEQAKMVADYLLTLKLAKVASGIVEDGKAFSRRDEQKVRRLFEKDYGCFGCHQVKNPKGEVVGGISGPELVQAGLRLRGDWIYTYLRDTRSLIPPTRMPNLKLSEEDAKALAQYVTTFK